MKIDWIEPGVIAAGGIPVGVQDLQFLHDQGIRAMMTLTEHPLTVQERITSNILDEIGLTCLHAPIKDQHPPDRSTVNMATQFIYQMRKQECPVYVHCHAGIGRTGTMLHAYFLMQGLSLEEAKAKVKAGKPSSQFLMLSDAQRAFLEEMGRDNVFRPYVGLRHET